MHGLLPAKISRRTLTAAAVGAVLAAAAVGPLVLSSPAYAAGQVHASDQARRSTSARAVQSSAVSIAIDSMSPQYAGRGQTVTVTGTVTNTSSQTLAGLQVQLFSSATPFSTRYSMDAYLTNPADANVIQAGDPFPVPASLRPGATAQWHASFQVDALGMSAFGVYPLAAQVQDMAGNLVASDQTLLPFWQSDAGDIQRLKVAWVWPLIDQPHHQICDALTDNSLASGLAPGGRLLGLLAAGQSHPDADLTWAIDPALLGDAQTMTAPYHVGSAVNCLGTTSYPASSVAYPASPAARNWLSGLRQVTTSQQTFITPYANVDTSALVHHGLTGDLANAYTEGGTTASSVLGGASGASLGTSVAWPEGGLADLSVLTALASTEHVSTAVLSSGEMPQTDPADAEENAVASISTITGVTMNVLLADDTIAGMLKASSGMSSQSAQFATAQRFLAETAMIVAQAPETGRSVVVTPPSDWDPTQALASALLAETVHAPWLQPTTLKNLVSAKGKDSAAGHLSRQPPPANKVSKTELNGHYLRTVSSLDGQLSLYEGILYQPPPGRLLALDEAVSAAESCSWRGARIGQGVALAGQLSGYLHDAVSNVKIITSGQVVLGGTSGSVPLSIKNYLHQAVQVRLTAMVSDRRLTIGKFKGVVTIQPGLVALVRLPVSGATAGSTIIQFHLTSNDGSPLQGDGTALTVHSTRYGRAILALIAAAIGVLVLSSGYRSVRKWLRDGKHGSPQGGDASDSVEVGTSGARHGGTG